MITFESVTKYYNGGQVVALENADLTIEEGEFIYLLGVSGAGKTTLFKLLIKEEAPSKGNIWFWEDNIVRMPRRKIPQLRRRIGMIFQDFKLLQQLKVAENIAFSMEVTGKSSHEINELVPRILNQVGLSDRGQAYPHELSTGEQQRVAIARSLAHDPEVLLADEPTGNLDKRNAQQIVELLKEINESGTTVIMATHDLDLVKSTKNRVIEVQNGKVKEYKPS